MIGSDDQRSGPTTPALVHFKRDLVSHLNRLAGSCRGAACGCSGDSIHGLLVRNASSPAPQVLTCLWLSILSLSETESKTYTVRKCRSRSKANLPLAQFCRALRAPAAQGNKLARRQDFSIKVAELRGSN